MINCHIENQLERTKDNYSFLSQNKPDDMSDKQYTKLLIAKNRSVTMLEKALKQQSPSNIIEKLTA